MITSSYTLPQVTDTYSDTTTITIVETDAVSYTNTGASPATTTSTTSTITTVPTSPGFTPAISEESNTASDLNKRHPHDRTPNVSTRVTRNGTCDPSYQVLDFYFSPTEPKADYISTGNCGTIVHTPP
jgi:hypothetical protein